MMKREKYGETQEVAWNLSAFMIAEIAESLKRATNNYISRKYSIVFDCLKSVRMRICAYLEEEELKELKRYERELQVIIFEVNNHQGFEYTKDNKIAYAKLWMSIDEYNTLILKYLKKYGFLIPPKEDHTRMNA